MLLRFYFYTFFKYYLAKQWANESIAAFRAVSLVAISALDVLFVVFITVEKIAGYSIFRYRLLGLLLACIVFFCVYFYFISQGNSRVASEEFEDHILNKKQNRRLCWLVFVFLFLLPMALSVLIET